MVLPEVLCTISLVVNSIRDGLCCAYQMHHGSKRDEDMEQIIRKVVSDELLSASKDRFDNDEQHDDPRPKRQKDLFNTNFQSPPRSRNFFGTECCCRDYELVRTQRLDQHDWQQDEQNHPTPSLLPPIATASSLLDNDNDDDLSSSHPTTGKNNNQWTDTRHNSFETIGIQ